MITPTSSENATFLLHDLNGKTLISTPLESGLGKVAIPLVNISNGFYLWEFLTDSYTSKGKLVISR